MYPLWDNSYTYLPRSVGSGPLYMIFPLGWNACLIWARQVASTPKTRPKRGYMTITNMILHWAQIQCKKCAKEVHTSRSADEAEKQGIPSVALQVPFLTTWVITNFFWIVLPSLMQYSLIIHMVMTHSQQLQVLQVAVASEPQLVNVKDFVHNVWLLFLNPVACTIRNKLPCNIPGSVLKPELGTINFFH